MRKQEGKRFRVKAGNEEKEQGTKITRKDSFVPHTHTHTHTHTNNYANCLTPTPYLTHAPGTHTQTHLRMLELTYSVYRQHM